MDTKVNYDRDDFYWPVSEVLIRSMDVGPQVADALNQFIGGLRIELVLDGSRLFIHTDPESERNKAEPYVCVYAPLDEYGCDPVLMIPFREIVRAEVLDAIEDGGDDDVVAFIGVMKSIMSACAGELRDRGPHEA